VCLVARSVLLQLQHTVGATTETDRETDYFDETDRLTERLTCDRWLTEPRQSEN